jgi:hypothetical protein
LLSGDGQKINFTENTLNDIGEATVNIGRIPGSGGVSGSGVLLTLTFQPVARGASTVSVVDSSFRNLQMQPITVTEPTVNIVVQ